MNYRMVFHIIGRVVVLESALLLLPLLVSICYNEACVWSFVWTIAAALVLGAALTLISRPKNRGVFAREGFAIVALSWLLLSFVGALPFYLSGVTAHYVDALFETVSGFTTTGASIIPNVELLPRGILFWRSFTHWVGGMGVLVLVMVIVSRSPDRSMNILKAEMPGPVVGKLLPRAKDTSRILYLIYFGMTVLEIILLLLGGMPLYDSVVHAFGTAGTGGFGIKADSIASYSPYLQWVITAFMLLFGVNFNLYFLLLLRRWREVFRSAELRTYGAVIVSSIAIITCNIYHMCSSLGESLRLASFQVASIATTTGYATTDFNLWPGLSKAILFLLMLMGACAGSTAGGLKVSRVVILWQLMRQEVRHIVHPRAVSAVRYEGKALDREALRNTAVYFALYFACMISTFLLISWEPFGFETNFTAAATCFNNVGPGFDMVGPTGNFAAFSPFSKLVLAFAMLLGRLEIFPMLLVLSPVTWRNK